MQQITEHLVSLVQDNSSDVIDISAQMDQLEAIKFAVAGLMRAIDDITFNGLDKEPVLAAMSIKEIEKKVRLIDMGFVYLYKNMQKSIESLEGTSSELFDMVVKPSHSNTPNLKG